MQIALALLMSAVQLLGLVRSVPNLPEEVKVSAITIANQAIAYAQNEIASLPKNQNPIYSPVPPTPGPVSPIPVFGSIGYVGIPTTIVVKFANGYPPYGGNCSMITYFTKVLDQNNQEIPNETVSLVSPYVQSTTGSIGFYIAQPDGSIDLTFRSGILSTTTTLKLASMRDFLIDSSDGSLRLTHARINNPETPNLITNALSSQTFDLDTNTCK